MKPVVAAGVSTAAVALAAAVSIVSDSTGLAVAILVVAAVANFVLVWRTQQAAQLPRNALVGVVGDVLAVAQTRVIGSGLRVGLALWRPRKDGCLGVVCATPDIGQMLDGQRIQKPDASNAVWSTYDSREMRFHIVPMANPQPGQQGAPAHVNGNQWHWVLSHPVLDVQDAVKCAGVIATLGHERIADFVPVETSGAMAELELAAYSVRRATSLLASHD